MLPTRLNLSLRGLDILAIVCPMCNDVVETVYHVFLVVTLLLMFGALSKDGPI